MDDDKLASALGLRPLSEIEENKEIVVVAAASNSVAIPEIVEDTEIIRDIDLAKDNIKSIIEKGDAALTDVISIASQSQSPRAYEVASTIMKTLLDANRELVEMSTKKKFAVDEVNAPKEAAQTNVTNNNLIVSTADLLKMIKGET